MSSFVCLHNVLAEIIAILFINSLRSRSERVVTRASACVCKKCCEISCETRNSWQCLCERGLWRYCGVYLTVGNECTSLIRLTTCNAVDWLSKRKLIIPCDCVLKLKPKPNDTQYINDLRHGETISNRKRSDCVCVRDTFRVNQRISFKCQMELQK